MKLARLLEIGRKLPSKTPRQVAGRAYEEVARVAWQPWTHVRPGLLTDRRLAA